MVQKATILIACSEEFKTALGDFAHRNKESMSAIIKLAVAEYIGYDIKNEEIVDKRRKYASEDERRAAQNKRAKEKRDEIAKFAELFAHEEHLNNVEALTNYLKAKGLQTE